MTTSKYEVVKVLGKGSFGVVRLVREKVEQE
jgi:serine/threonine protein kinase